MNERTRISIAMAVYNGERFISEQLDSFVRQTRLPDELVVSDNASTDRTVEIVHEFAARAPFPVRLFINDRNLGVAKNFERAISECAGDIIFPSDCDDIWYPDKLLLMERALERAPEAGIALCDADLVGDSPVSARPLARRLWQAQRFALKRREEMKIARAEAFSRRVPTYGNCMAVRTKFRPLFLPLPEGSCFAHFSGHDTFIAHVIVCAGAGIALVPKPLLAYRQHRGQQAGAGDRSLLKRVKLDWRTRGNESSLPLLEAVVQRLEKTPPPESAAQAGLRAAVLQHYRARCNLGRRKIARAPVVLRELMTLRYRRFSRGILSAAKDLMFVK